jgi:hypothetical protein
VEKGRLTVEQATAHIMDLFWRRPESLTLSERAAMVIIKELARAEEELVVFRSLYRD